MTTRPKTKLDEKDIARLDFEYGANMVSGWLSAAEDLLSSAQAVKGQVRFVGELMHSLAAVWALLLGLAIECLLKGKWVKDGNKLVQPGTDRLQRIPGAGRDHRLLPLADSTGFKLSAEERDVLERLSAFVVWAGRYPVPMNPQDLLMRRKIAPRFFSREDFASSERLANRLKTELMRAQFARGSC